MRAMKVDNMDDRSTFEELKEAVIDYLVNECREGDDDMDFDDDDDDDEDNDDYEQM